MANSSVIGRFAPSTTGPAHPGTLLAALLCWLDVRARPGGARVFLRLEDLDPQRSSPERVAAMERDLAWLGLDWDGVFVQSRAADAHAEALDQLADAGLLYPCACTRSEIRAGGRPAPDGGFAYENTCRARSLPSRGWRECAEPLRVRLRDEHLDLRDESGLDLSMNPSRALGDPVVRRRDGGVAYQLASVVDDATAGVTRVVRGRDLATSSATQVALALLLGLEPPTFRHHLLLLETRGDKLAKLHGAVGIDELRPHYDARALCGWLALAAGLRPDASPCSPAELAAEFRWEAVRERDVVTLWEGAQLRISSTEASPGTPTRSGKP